MMRLYITTEHRFGTTPDGDQVSLTGGRGYEFWKRYLEIFEAVSIIGRVDSAPREYPGLQVANGPGVDIISTPNYKGLHGLIRALPGIWNAMGRTGKGDSAYLLRVPGLMGTAAALRLWRARVPYALEVVGDPAGVYAKGASHHPLRYLVQKVSVALLRWQCSRATATAYVTDHTLQEAYPPRFGAFTTSFSSVELSDDAFIFDPPPKIPRLDNTHPTIITVGSLEQPYKGVDTLLSAIAILAQSGTCVRLRVVGDGRYRESLERQASQLGISDRVSFVGHLSQDGVRRELDGADLFVLASRTEGLPRAMIEAMARGLPCIGTRVGGIPELLSHDCLVTADCPGELAAKVAGSIESPGNMSLQASRNLQKAREYHKTLLQARRTVFYRELRQRTADWYQHR